MKKKSGQNEAAFRNGLIGVCKVHFALVALFIAQIVIYDSSMLIPPEVVKQRWMAITLLLATTGMVWYFAKVRAGHLRFYKSLLSVMILADILLASFFVYSTRGMASRELILYTLPIIMAGLLLSRAALFATAILSIAAYSLTAIEYFVNNFNEGYKVELYGEVGFFSILFLVIASLLSVVLHPKE